jgi:hypothetical protein
MKYYEDVDLDFRTGVRFLQRWLHDESIAESDDKTGGFHTGRLLPSGAQQSGHDPGRSFPDALFL